jgi:formylglycine-generating enzyme required for sulfatase activity
MLLNCPNPQCQQRLVLQPGFGKLPCVCPCCGTDLQKTIAVAIPALKTESSPGERALALDGAEMVYVPAGPFSMGSDLSEIEKTFVSASRKYQDILWVWFEREFPKHEINLPGFWIEILPVTCARYQQFCERSGYRTPESWMNGRMPEGQENHPVVDVSWEDVLAYCQWVGKRPPYESEWEKAARGTDRRTWPWGNEFIAEGGNIDRSSAAGTRPAGSFPQGASPYGCLDMAGNVFQWTRDICVPYPGYQETDELIRARQEHHKTGFERLVVFKDGAQVEENRPFQFFGGVARGGAWASCAEYCRSAFRLETQGKSTLIGFRCVLGEDPCDQSRDLGKQGKSLESLAAAEHSLALSPNYPTALYNAGFALQRLNRFQEAVEKFRQLVSLWPTDSDSWNQLGMCQDRIGQISAAVRSYDSAINANPFNPDIWYNKAKGLDHLLQKLLSPHTIAGAGGRLVVDLQKVPSEVVLAVARLDAEAAGCFQRARRLGAGDDEVINGAALTKQQSDKMLENLRGRMDKYKFLRAMEDVGFSEAFPTIQHVWAVVRLVHAQANFSYDLLRKRGFNDSESSTGLTYLKTWGRIEVVALETFRVAHPDEISAYDPWREYG